MKKIIAILTLLLLAGVVVTAQNPFIKDQSEVYLKVQTDKVGIGIPPTADKLTVGSVSGETILGLKGSANFYNPFITLYNSNSVAVWKLFANPDWFVIGKSRDTSQALIVGRLDDDWLKINGTVAATKMQATTGAYTNLTAGTATVTTLVSTTGTITNLGSTTATITTLALLGNATTKTLTTTGDISASGTITSTGNFYGDASFYFGDDYTNAWRAWAIPVAGIPFSRIKLENIDNISIQAKGSLNQVTAIERDTTGPTAKINLPNVNHLEASDTTGIVLTSSIGTKYRLFITASGTVSVTVVP
jgi:hypothetical protein